MPPELDLEAIALEMKTAQDCVNQIQPFTARVRGFDLSAAYKVARLMHTIRLKEGATPVGRKIGFTNPNMWSKFGVRAPIWAYIYNTTVVQLNSSRAVCQIGKFAEPKIEPEIVFHFRTAPPADAQLADVVNAIDWVAHGFEIVQSHFPGWRFQAPDTVADWGLHGTLLVGPTQPLSELGSDPVAALESFSLTLSRGGQIVESGRGADVLGSPLSAIIHLASVLANQPEFERLKANEIVTTGTITTAQSVNVGETWQSKLDGINLTGLEVEFVP